MALAVFFLLSAVVHVAHNLDYKDLEALGKSCPQRDKCEGYKNNLNYLDRSCECDSACHTYGDCCIDVRRRGSSNRQGTRPRARNGMVCMPYGEKLNAGVYAITRCSGDWKGSAEVREKCEASAIDFSDPLLAVPVISVVESKTYKNRYCAECNNADRSSLEEFQFRIVCEGFKDISEDQLFADITYNKDLNIWGVNRNSNDGEKQFHKCKVLFDVPEYFNNNVRFCRSNLISSCPSTWTRNTVKKACDEYMAVVFDKNRAYRNPHCAICNDRTVDQLTCISSASGQAKPVSFTILLDINRKDGDRVGMINRCEKNEKFDPFFNKCRGMVCILPGYTVVDGKCVSA